MAQALHSTMSLSAPLVVIAAGLHGCTTNQNLSSAALPTTRSCHNLQSFTSRHYLPNSAQKITFRSPSVPAPIILDSLPGFRYESIHERKLRLLAPAGWSCHVIITADNNIEEIQFWEGDETPAYDKSENFRNACIENGVASLFFFQNPYLEIENLTVSLNQSLQAHTPILPRIVSLAEIDTFAPRDNAVFCLPDHHGSHEKIRTAMTLFSNPAIEWMSLEMPQRLNSALHTFIFGDPKSSEYVCASKLIEDYESGVSSLFDNRNDSVNEMSILLLAQQLKKPIYAVDADELYSAAYPIEDPISYQTRNYLWASLSPKTGTGMIFGGENHFINSPTYSVIDYLGIISERKIFLLHD